MNHTTPHIYEDRRTLVEIHTADLHFGAFDPKLQYEILMDQMINKIRNLHFDAFFINGDIFHHKFMSNSDVIMYASLFIEQVVMLCRKNNATLVILHGTGSHDANQLKLFYHYIGTLDIRIVEHTQFEYIKGSRVLCIPEEYGMGEEYYNNFLHNSGIYDMVVLHGAVKGSIYGCNEVDLNSSKAPVFDISCFDNCTGPIICGHVHVSHCYQDHIYYSGSPLRWKFGEETMKGFIVCLYNAMTGQYYINLEEVVSFRYDTICLDELSHKDPREIIEYINSCKARGIDYLKVKFSEPNERTNVVKRYYSNINDIVIDAADVSFSQSIKNNAEKNDKFKEYDYILNTNMSPEEIFVRYVNQCKGCEFITVDDLIKILSD